MADKNYLGLGVVFRGVDEGFDKTVKDVQDNIGKTSKMMDSLRESFSRPPDQTGMSNLTQTTPPPPPAMPPMMNPNQSVVSPAEQANLDKYNEAMSGKFTPRVKAAKNAIEEFGIKFSKAMEPVRHAGRSLADVGSGMSKMGESIKNSLSSITLLKLLSDTKPIQTLLSGTQDIPQYIKDFDMLGARMRVTFDPKPVSKFMSAVSTNMARFGVSANDSLKLAQTMNQFGVSLEKSTKVMPMMGQMVGVLKMDVEDVAKMFGQASKTLEIMPQDMTKMIKRVTAMGKAWNIMDFVSDLPEVVASVTDNMRKLGKVDAKVAAQNIESTMTLKAKYVSLGLGTKQATEAAIKMGSKLASLKDSILDLQAGLEPQDTDLFDKVLPELVRVTGKDAASIYQDLMTMGPDAINDMLVKQAQAMDEGPGKNRFMRSMKSVFGDELYRQMVGGEAVNKAAIEAGKKLGEIDQSKLWDKQTGAMKHTFQFAGDLRKSNEELYDIQKKMAYKDAYLKMLNAQTSALQNLQSIITSATTATEKLLRKTFLHADALKVGGSSTVAYMHGLDGAGKSAAQLSIYLKEASSVADALQQAMAGFGTGMGMVAGVLGSIASGIGAAMLKMGGFGKLITGLGNKMGSFWKWTKGLFSKTLTDPMSKATEELLKMDKSRGVFTRIQSGINSMINSVRGLKIFESIGGWFTKGFSVVKDGITSIGSWASKAFSPITEAFGKFGSMFDALKSKVGSILESFGGLGKVFSWAGKLASKLLVPLGLLWESFNIGENVGKIMSDLMEVFAPEAWNKVLGFIDSTIGKLANTFGKIPWLGEAVFGPKAKDQIGFTGKVEQGATAKPMDKTTNLPVPEVKPMEKTVEPSPAPAMKSMDKAVEAPGAKIIPFPREVFQTAKMPIPDNAVSAPVIPLNQPGAPRKAVLGDKHKPIAVGGDEGIDTLVIAIEDLKEALNSGLASIAHRPVAVTITGDMKKFMRVMNSQMKDSGTSGELQNALGG